MQQDSTIRRAKRTQPSRTHRQSTAMPKVTIDTEWHYREDDPKKGQFRCASWYWQGKLYGTHDIMQLVDFMATLPTPIVMQGHNIVSDIKKLIEWEVPLPPIFRLEDSLIAARFLHPLLPDKNLKKLGRMYGYVYKDKHDIEDPKALLDYCGKDTYTSSKLIDQYHSETEEDAAQYKALKMYYNIQQAFIPMELAGLKLDVPRLQREQTSLHKQLIELIPKLPSPDIITNDNVLRDWLSTQYTKHELKVLPFSKKSGDQQIGKDFLKMLTPSSPTLEHITEAREAQRHKTFFIERPLKFMNEHGFIFPSYKILVARTQRRSTEPSIQNWPDKARRFIISRFKGGKIVSRDFASLEARIFAWQSGCKDFLNALIEGGYIRVAEQCLGIKIKDKKDERYKQVKSTVLAVTYNMSPGLFSYREYIKSQGKKRMSKEEAQSHYDVLFNRYPEINTEMERRREYAWKYGSAYSSVGAPLVLPIIPDDLLPDDEAWVARYRKRIENMAINSPTQQMAAYVTGCALWDIQKELAGSNWGAYLDQTFNTTRKTTTTKLNYIPIIEVHDALVADCKADYVDECDSFLHTYMTAGKSLKELLPTFDTSILNTESKIAKTWDGEE